MVEEKVILTALEPCPFCGEVATKERDMHYQLLAGTKLYYINCNRCGGEGPGRYTEEEAVRLWNKRPPTFQPIDTLPNEYLHNEELVMIKLTHGVVSAWFEPYRTFDTPDGIEHDGGMWIALDDDLQFEMDSVTHWAPMIKEHLNND